MHHRIHLLSPSLFLQFIPNARFAQIRHTHNLHHHARPSREMLRSLALSCLGVVLLPREARSLPIVKDVLYKVLAEVSVQLCGLCFVWARCLCDVLEAKLALMVSNREQVGEKKDVPKELCQLGS